MRTAFVHLLAPLGVAAAAADRAFDRLAAAYQEPHRRYHTLEHVAETLAVVDRLRDQGVDPIAVPLAVWYHDAVYDPRAHDNEGRSADLAREALAALGVAEPLALKVEALVRATAHLAGNEAPADFDTTVLLDADLAILGSDATRYARYAAAVREEYAFVPDDAYRGGRAAVLERFLARPRIYRTDLLHSDCEEAARRNLRAEIDRLRA
jgi:predicted metal-dependent HD superfamily phosphohydrolase